MTQYGYRHANRIASTLSMPAPNLDSARIAKSRFGISIRPRNNRREHRDARDPLPGVDRLRANVARGA
jgi:hypothetical protein